MSGNTMGNASLDKGCMVSSLASNSVALLIVLFALFPITAFARTTDKQANNAYELISSGCVIVNNEIPFFKGSPHTASRKETGNSVQERRQYSRGEVQTHFESGKLFMRRVKVLAEFVPRDLEAVFQLSLFEFFSRYGVGERGGRGNYIYSDGLLELTARFEKKRLIELNWVCGLD